MKTRDNITINILTRTSNRPNGFKQCYESVRQQTYPNIKHFVSYDNNLTFEYIKDLDVSPVEVIKSKGIDKPQVDSEGNLYAPYNLYCNELLDKVVDGWIMFLDDDDRLYHDCIISELVKEIEKHSEDTLFISRMRYPNGKVLPSSASIKTSQIKQNDIGSPCVLFHAKYKASVKWDDYKRSDFRFIKQLEEGVPQKIFLDNIIAQINNFGDFGRQNDIDSKLPTSFFKTKLLWHIIPKYHQKVGDVYIFHKNTYQGFFKKVNLKLKHIFKF